MDRLVGHHRRYTLATLRPLFKQAGFEVKGCRYRDSLGFLATLAYKYLGRSDGTISRGALRTYDRWVFPVSRRVDVLTGPLFGKNAMVYAVKK